MAFKAWHDQKLKNICEVMKSRVMQKDEVLFEDRTRAEMLYFLISGSLRIEKEVEISKENFWPVHSHEWQSTKVNQKVLFKIREVKPYQLIGEKQMMGSLAYPVRVVASTPGTTVLMLHRRDFHKSFSSKDG